MNKFRGLALGLTFSLAIFAGGCASHSATTVDEEQFATIFNDTETNNMVLYMGSDDRYDYFCMEHVTVNKDGTDATLDKKTYYRVALMNQKIKNPFPLTSNEDKWRILRPKLPGSST